MWVRGGAVIESRSRNTSRVIYATGPAFLASISTHNFVHNYSYYLLQLYASRPPSHPCRQWNEVTRVTTGRLSHLLHSPAPYCTL